MNVWFGIMIGGQVKENYGLAYWYLKRNKNFCRKQKQKNWICANCLGMTEFQSSCKIGKKIRSKDIKEQLRVSLRYITRPDLRNSILGKKRAAYLFVYAASYSSTVHY